MINLVQYGKSILTALVNQAWSVYRNNSGDRIYNPADYTYNSQNNTLVEKKFGWPERVYLGFSTTIPSVSAAGVVSDFTEPSTGNYQRAELTAKGLEGHNILAAVDVIEKKITVFDDVNDETGLTMTRKVARVRNHEEVIMFPYTGKQDLQGTNPGYGADPIVYFGLFKQQKTSGSADTPFIFGPLTESLTIPANVVPLVLKDEFELTYG